MVNKTLVWTKKYLQVKWDQSNNYLCNNNNSVIIIITQYFIVIKFLFFAKNSKKSTVLCFQKQIGSQWLHVAYYAC